MKKFLIVAACIFGALAIIFYIVSIKEVSGYQIANIQSTVFCAACAIICALNIVGAIILNYLESYNGGGVSYSDSSAGYSVHGPYHR